MGQASRAERALLTAWQVELLRLTVFPSLPAQITSETWWHDIVGQAPESSTSQPRRRALVQEGAVAGGRLVLSVEPARIDWRLLPLESQKLEPEPFLTIGTLPDAIQSFAAFIERWFDLESYPLVKRLAFGALISQPVDDRQAGYLQLSTYLPSVTLDPENSSDFIYRINRSRLSTSGFADFRVNRLSTWMVRASALSQLSIGLESAQYSVGQIIYACQLELDINTAPEYSGQFSAKESRAVFQELVRLGEEIAREGDIP
jgi:hypothetical protein